MRVVVIIIERLVQLLFIPFHRRIPLERILNSNFKKKDLHLSKTSLIPALLRILIPRVVQARSKMRAVRSASSRGARRGGERKVF